MMALSTRPNTACLEALAERPASKAPGGNAQDAAPRTEREFEHNTALFRSADCHVGESCLPTDHNPNGLRPFLLAAFATPDDAPTGFAEVSAQWLACKLANISPEHIWPGCGKLAPTARIRQGREVPKVRCFDTDALCPPTVAAAAAAAAALEVCGANAEASDWPMAGAST